MASTAMALPSEKSEPATFAGRGYPPGTGHPGGTAGVGGWAGVAEANLYQQFPEGSSLVGSSPMADMQAKALQNYQAAMLQQMAATSPPGFPGMYYLGVPYGYGGGQGPSMTTFGHGKQQQHTGSSARTESQESTILTEDMAVAGLTSGGVRNMGSPVPGMQHGSSPTPNASPTPSKGSKDSSRRDKWTVEEHRLFLKGLEAFGKGSWRDVSRHYVKTKTCTQVASHAQKYFKRQAAAAAAREQGVDTGRKRASIHDTALLPEHEPGDREGNSATIGGPRARSIESIQLGFASKGGVTMPEGRPLGSKSALTAGLVSPFVPVIPAAPAASPVAMAARQDAVLQPVTTLGSAQCPSGSPSFGRFVDIVLDMDGDLISPCK